MNRILFTLIFIFILSTFLINGQTVFTVDNIKYTTISTTTVEITSAQNCTGSYIIPSKVIYLGTTYTITSIGYWAFEDCYSLFTITIPASITSIKDHAFGYKGVKYIVDTNNQYFSSQDDVLYNKSKTMILSYPSSKTDNSFVIPSTVIEIANYAFENSRHLTKITIPPSVFAIGDYAFSGCYVLANISIPNSITSIGGNAFSSTALTSILIPSSVITIGSNAFNMCENLSNITLSASLVKIEASLFYNCTSLSKITIPNSVTSIGNGAFNHCSSLSNITIPTSVTNIGFDAFSFCQNITSINIPFSVTTIGNCPFRAGGIASINVDANNPNYSSKDGVLYNKNKTTIVECPPMKTGVFTIPETVTKISNFAFDACELLTDITIPSTVTSIGYYGIAECTGLSNLSIPSSVSTINDYAFVGNTGLTSFYANSTTPVRVNSNVFYSINKTTCTLYVPKGSKSLYQVATGWKDFNNIVEITTAVPQIKALNLRVYPNPFKDFIKIKGIEAISNLSIYNLQGNELLNSSIFPNEDIPVSSLPKGIYVVTIKSNEGEYVTKIVKE